jgi:hypothetical protein
VKAAAEQAKAESQLLGPRGRVGDLPQVHGIARDTSRLRAYTGDDTA